MKCSIYNSYGKRFLISAETVEEKQYIKADWHLRNSIVSVPLVFSYGVSQVELLRKYPVLVIMSCICWPIQGCNWPASEYDNYWEKIFKRVEKLK